MKKKTIILGIIIFVIFSIMAFLIIFCYANRERKTLTQPYSTSNKCNEDDGYCVYKYDEKEYFVLNKGYNSEYDIEYFDINTSDIKNTKEFSYLTYAEYGDFCEKYGITKKYNNEDSNYIIYFYSAEIANSIDAKLGNVKYENDKTTLYIWDKVNYNGDIIADDGTRKAYVIIVPTNIEVSDYEVKPIIHKIEYNKIAKLNPLDGYTYSIDDNKKLALQDHINSNDSRLNEIINKSLDELGNKHTIKVDTYIDNFDTHLISYMDLVNSVFKIQTGTKALHYIGYADDMRLLYVNYGGDYYSYDYTYIDRSIMLYDVFAEFGNNFLQNIDKYEISLNEDNDDYIIESNLNSYNDAKYYINKKTYLIDKIITENRTNKFSYTSDNILIPDDIDTDGYPITVDKPIIYIYPDKKINVNVKLGHSDLLTVSYPQYNNGWNVIASPNGNLKDVISNKNYYGLYYEAKNHKTSMKKDGFIIEGKDTISFLEEKLDILGLNEREINEFIIYWLPKLENNKYNYIRFETLEEIESYMPIEITPKPDTVIRIIMDYKPLKERIQVEEQKLTPQKRVGYSVVEWGGSEIK